MGSKLKILVNSGLFVSLISYGLKLLKYLCYSFCLAIIISDGLGILSKILYVIISYILVNILDYLKTKFGDSREEKKKRIVRK